MLLQKEIKHVQARHLIKRADLRTSGSSIPCATDIPLSFQASRPLSKSNCTNHPPPSPPSALESLVHREENQPGRAMGRRIKIHFCSSSARPFLLPCLPMSELDWAAQELTFPLSNTPSFLVLQCRQFLFYSLPSPSSSPPPVVLFLQWSGSAFILSSCLSISLSLSSTLCLSIYLLCYTALSSFVNFYALSSPSLCFPSSDHPPRSSGTKSSSTTHSCYPTLLVGIRL